MTVLPVYLVNTIACKPLGKPVCSLCALLCTLIKSCFGKSNHSKSNFFGVIQSLYNFIIADSSKHHDLFIERQKDWNTSPSDNEGTE